MYKSAFKEDWRPQETQENKMSNNTNLQVDKFQFFSLKKLTLMSDNTCSDELVDMIVKLFQKEFNILTYAENRLFI